MLCKQSGKMGIALDGDADRAILVDEKGRVWTGDRIVAMLANYLKEHGELANNVVVLTEYSNLAAIKYLEANGIRVEKVVNGDRKVAKKLQELGGVLGGENAGHIIYLPWFCSSDGSFVALFARKIMAEKNCLLADLWPEYEEFPNAQIGVKVREKPDFKDIPGLTAAIEEGTRQLDGRGRVFLRYSGTEMKLRILVEGPDLREDTEIAEKLNEIIKKEIGND
jgi:phosphoglucosamine mutase